ncbi:MAG: hypothetical protein ACI835_002659 [Planctomycetota bacterium]|jgi:hypothetical protein
MNSRSLLRLLPLSIACCLLALVAQTQESEEDAQRERAKWMAQLTSVVDMQSEPQRKSAAIALARKQDVRIEQWLEWLPSFGEFTDTHVRGRVEVVALPEDDLPVETDLHVYAPPGYDGTTPAHLMMMFHGTGGSGRGMCEIWREIADEFGMLV